MGGENSFPTDAYIERVIHGSEQPVLSEEQVTLWEKRYSQPAQFDDVLEAMSYITEAERFFPRESIGLKETLDGKVEVRVTKPVYVGPNMSLEEFAKEQERQAQEWREVQQRDAIEAEKLLIKQKAIADGTFMLAPNGKPSNLTEDQWLSIRTKAFKEWFGDWEKFTNISKELLEQVSLVFERNPELAKVGTIAEYAAYLKEIFPNSKDKEIYWHGSNSDFSQGFDSAIKGIGSGSPHIDGEFYLAKQAWTVLQYVNGVNRSFGPDINGFNHWNKLWWELKEIMSNGRRENNDWKNLIIGPDNVRQAIPNKKGIFNRDSGGENGKWLKGVKL